MSSLEGWFYVYLPVCLSVYLTVCLFDACLSVCLRLNLWSLRLLEGQCQWAGERVVYMFLCQFLCLFVYLSVCHFVCLSTCLSVCLFVCLSVTILLSSTSRRGRCPPSACGLERGGESLMQICSPIYLSAILSVSLKIVYWSIGLSIYFTFMSCSEAFSASFETRSSIFVRPSAFLLHSMYVFFMSLSFLNFFCDIFLFVRMYVSMVSVCLFAIDIEKLIEIARPWYL